MSRRRKWARLWFGSYKKIKKNFNWDKRKSILYNKGVQYFFTHELHTLLYAILCVKFDITSVNTEMRSERRLSRRAGYTGEIYGDKERVQGRRSRRCRWGVGAEPPPPILSHIEPYWEVATIEHGLEQTAILREALLGSFTVFVIIRRESVVFRQTARHVTS